MSQREELHEVIKTWHERSKKTQNAHYQAGNMYEKRFITLGIIVVVLSVLLGGVEVLVPSGEGIWSAENTKRFSGVISLCVGILAGLQTFLKLSQRSERHRMAGANYGEIRRSLEELVIICEKSDDLALVELDKIKEKMDSYAIQSPEIPQTIYLKNIDSEDI